MDLTSIVVATRSLKAEMLILKNIGAEYKQEIVLVSGKCPSFQRNKGVEAASGSIIYFIDDDSVPMGDVFRKAQKIFDRDEKVAVVGGPAVATQGDTFMQKTFGEVLGTKWATGKSMARYKKAGKQRETSEKEMILCNMFVRKEIMEKFGGFNENLYPNEENEFLNKVQSKGYKIIYDPDIYVSRSHRDTIGDFFMQCFTYGRGRAEQVLTFFSSGDIVNFIPALFVMYLVFINVSRYGGILNMPLYLYLALTATFSIKAAVDLRNIPSFFIFLFEFPMVHVAYGCGFIYGFFKHIVSRGKKAINRQIEIKVIKGK